MPAVATGILTIRVSSRPKNLRTEEGKEAERRKTRTYRPHPSGCGARRALRARLSASHHGSDLRDYSSQRLTSGQASCEGCHWAGLPAGIVPHFQRCTSRAGRNAGGLMPETPGCRGDEPPPAGTDSRSAMRSDRITSLYGSEIDCLFSNPERDVTESFPAATCAHLAGLSELYELRHQRQCQCALSIKIRF
jgi:hypothetical protein